MAGAAQATRQKRVLIWEGAMLQRAEKFPSLEQYTGLKPPPQPAAMLDMRLRASVRGLRAITLQEHLAGLRK